MWSALASAAGSLLGGRFLPKMFGGVSQRQGFDLGGSLGSGIVSQMPGMSVGALSGEQARKFMNEAYPGTNPWERLGAGGGNAVGSQVSSHRHQKDLQRKDLASKERVAKIQADASMRSAAIPLGPAAVNAIAKGTGGVDHYGDYDSAVNQGRDLVPFRQQNLSADALSKVGKAYFDFNQALESGQRYRLNEPRERFAHIMAMYDGLKGIPVARKFMMWNEFLKTVAGGQTKDPFRAWFPEKGQDAPGFKGMMKTLMRYGMKQREARNYLDRLKKAFLPKPPRQSYPSGVPIPMAKPDRFDPGPDIR